MSWKRTFIRSTLIGIAVLGTILGIGIWNFNQPPHAYYAVQNLSRHATKEETIRMLGSPGSVQQNGKVLVYTRLLSWGILYVNLDGEGRYLSYSYDK
ncbi:hypothetical protein Mal52_17730 [Symmachiella dynata]|uniref:Lipoprotein SmpA/OmlA domain-containing protein n=1 Tax=Symmachiella dynata TaxID=2527995 RepID=A0A517ZLD9_9PLAN|nr:hypothetical protein Mal52_17730 [Symmachiella dynata]